MCARVWVRGAVAAAVTVALHGSPAWAGEPLSTLRDALFGRPTHDDAREFSPPGVARYRVDAGQSFTFDRGAGADALLKFDDDPEVWALKPTAGPRGDVIYKNDIGEVVVRATRLGGLTLFTTDRPEGSAAALLGQAAMPRPSVPPLGPEGLHFLAVQASGRASRAAQHLVSFDASDADVTPTSEAVFAQAFFVTAEAFVHVSQRVKAGPKALGRFFVVRFLSGPGPAAVARGPTVQITVAPQLGVAGRPSSERIADVMLRH